MTDRQTVASAYARIESHEDLCAERYGNIHTAITELKADISGSKRTIDKIVWLALTTLIAVAGWLGSQLFKATANHVEERAAAVSTEAK